MPAPILTTKLNPPQLRRHVVLRQHSLDLIFAGLRDGRKLTLIAAPAGFGKTTLARAWIAASGLPVAWLALDEGDANPAQFLAYLVAALQTVIAGVGTELLAALATPHPPAPASLLDSLLNELNLNEEPFVLALDDYHLVASKPVDALLNRLVERMPSALHLLITTREDPALPLARLRVRNQLTEIRASDLRFSTAEATEFLNQVMGLRLAAADVAVLEQRTEGWAAGLQLAAVTALQGLRKGGLKPGHHVAIVGASGGVGTFAVQLAKALGAHVTAIASTKKLEQLRSLGADHVLDYTREDFTQTGQRYDLILAVNGYRPLAAYRRVLTPQGTYVMVGGKGKQIAEALILGPLVSRRGGQTVTSLMAAPNAADLAFVTTLIEAGQVTPVLEQTYTLEATADAVRHVCAGHATGKVVIRIQPGAG